MFIKKIVVAIIVTVIGLFLAGCATNSEVVSENISQSAEQFEVNRRVVFFNGITDKYLLEIQGFCSVETSESKLNGSLEVTCKTGPTTYKKHFLGLSDNVSYLVEQIESSNASPYNYRVIFKPDVIIPDVDVNTKIGK